MFATDKAKAEGLTLVSADYRQPCPKCSPERRKKRDPCLHVTVLHGEIRCKCFHCDWGAVFTDDDDRRNNIRSPHGRSARSRAGARQRPQRWW